MANIIRKCREKLAAKAQQESEQTFEEISRDFLRDPQQQNNEDIVTTQEDTSTIKVSDTTSEPVNGRFFISLKRY